MGKKLEIEEILRHSSDLAANQETILCWCSGWQVIRCFRSICTIVTFTTGFQGCVVPATWESSGLSAQSTVIMWYRPAPVLCMCNGIQCFRLLILTCLERNDHSWKYRFASDSWWIAFWGSAWSLVTRGFDTQHYERGQSWAAGAERLPVC